MLYSATPFGTLNMWMLLPWVPMWTVPDRSGKSMVTQWPDIRFAQRVRAGSAAA